MSCSLGDEHQQMSDDVVIGRDSVKSLSTMLQRKERHFSPQPRAVEEDPPVKVAAHPMPANEKVRIVVVTRSFHYFIF
jgi:hypothetical protein